MSEPTAAPAVPHPQGGGSYTRNPVTGELERTAYSQTPDEHAAEQAAAAQQQPAQPE